MTNEELLEWLDRHHVDIIRTQVTSLDGPSIGKYLHREKFVKSVGAGHGISDMALAMDLSGSPHMTFWNDFRQGAFGDINIAPDIDTLITDGKDPNLGHCIGNFSGTSGTPIAICPRTALQKVVSLLDEQGLSAKASFELEFMLFKETFDEARNKGYKNLTPVAASRLPTIYMLKAAYHSKTFMDKVIERLNWQGILWEAWNDEAEPGQVELNLAPADPVKAADMVVRVKQLLYETAVDLGLSLTFMPKISNTFGSGMHIHHSLVSKETGEPVFYNTNSESRTDLLNHWLGGLMASLPGSISFLCPTINSFRRMVEFNAPPTRLTWGEENKSTALRMISRSPALTRIENRVPASDVNPYLALGVILASGLSGLRNNLSPPEEFKQIAWSIPDGLCEKLPNTITKAIDALEADPWLKKILGDDLVNYWAHSRRNEWIQFQTQSGDPYGSIATEWEFKRYFELI